MPVPNSRSSLTNHRFPAFYACYLLKSIQTPRSTATYIGSTPNPPRRIRQHNGEITQGAWKTKHKRPWVMQMIVHGFPSKLAALQFEWAWQHPHISRHLRDDSGHAVFSRGRNHKLLKSSVKIAHDMISSHPYNTWPLHVKLFTAEAVKAWQDIVEDPDLLLPLGFTCTTELEGVDGKSGKEGSGRANAIDVSDAQFTSSHLSKATALVSSSEPLLCSICNEEIVDPKLDTLDSGLCPTRSCSAVSHLTCLANHFLQRQPSGSDLIPRGGNCTSCHSYVLWGDIIRGSYRRQVGGAIAEPEPDSDSDEEEAANLKPTPFNAIPTSPGHAQGSPIRIRKSGSTPPDGQSRSKVVGKRSAKAANVAATRSSGSTSLTRDLYAANVTDVESSSVGEFFDLNKISSGDESDDAPAAPTLARTKPPSRTAMTRHAPRALSREFTVRTRGHKPGMGTMDTARHQEASPTSTHGQHISRAADRPDDDGGNGNPSTATILAAVGGWPPPVSVPSSGLQPGNEHRDQPQGRKECLRHSNAMAPTTPTREVIVLSD